MTESEFLAKWEDKAAEFQQRGATVNAAALCQAVFEDLALLRACQENRLLSLAEAASVSGYSADHLGRLVRRGTLENHGRANAPKVRLGSLPRKPGLRTRT